MAYVRILVNDFVFAYERLVENEKKLEIIECVAYFQTYTSRTRAGHPANAVREHKIIMSYASDAELNRKERKDPELCSCAVGQSTFFKNYNL